MTTRIAVRPRRKPRASIIRVGDAVLTGLPREDEIAGFDTFPALVHAPTGVEYGQVHIFECDWSGNSARFDHLTEMLEFVRAAPQQMKRFKQQFVQPRLIRGERGVFLALTEIFEPSVDVISLARALRRVAPELVASFAAFLGLEWFRALSFHDASTSRGSARLRVSAGGRAVMVYGPPPVPPEPISVTQVSRVDDPVLQSNHARLHPSAAFDQMLVVLGVRSALSIREFLAGRDWVRARALTSVPLEAVTEFARNGFYAAMRDGFRAANAPNLNEEFQELNDRFGFRRLVDGHRALAEIAARAHGIPWLTAEERAARFDELAEQSLECSEPFEVDAFLIEFGT